VLQNPSDGSPPSGDEAKPSDSADEADLAPAEEVESGGMSPSGFLPPVASLLATFIDTREELGRSVSGLLASEGIFDAISRNILPDFSRSSLRKAPSRRSRKTGRTI
jgi:hypothetical protein